MERWMRLLAIAAVGAAVAMIALLASPAQQELGAIDEMLFAVVTAGGTMLAVITGMGE